MFRFDLLSFYFLFLYLVTFFISLIRLHYSFSLSCFDPVPVDVHRNLLPVTQLYVSVDAATKDSLKKIDRPLFKDFWERFVDSLTALSDKGQRTVYRLTLVKAWNTEELESYAQLVSLGKPDFIEIKVQFKRTLAGRVKGLQCCLIKVAAKAQETSFDVCQS